MWAPQRPQPQIGLRSTVDPPRTHPGTKPPGQPQADPAPSHDQHSAVAALVRAQYPYSIGTILVHYQHKEWLPGACPSCRNPGSPEKPSASASTRPLRNPPSDRPTLWPLTDRPPDYPAARAPDQPPTDRPTGRLTAPPDHRGTDRPTMARPPGRWPTARTPTARTPTADRPTDGSGVSIGSILGPSGVHARSIRGRSGVKFGSIWSGSGVDLASILPRSGVATEWLLSRAGVDFGSRGRS